MRVALAAALIGLTGCGLRHLLDWDRAPAPHHAQLVSVTDSVLTTRVAQARSWVVGTVRHVTEWWEFDSHCGLFAQAQNACTGTQAYRIDLVDGSRFFAFVPHGQWLPFAEGDTALFILQRRVVFRLQKCNEQQGAAGSAYCDYYLEDVLVSNYDLLPPADSARVAAAFAARTRH